MRQKGLTLMTPTLASPEPITDDLIMDLLNPTEPALMRLVASFHLSMSLRHTMTLLAQGDHTDSAWLADMRSSLDALREVLG